MKNISQKVELFVATVDLKITKMVTTRNLVKIVLANCVVLKLAFTEINRRRIMFFSRQHIFKG